MKPVLNDLLSYVTIFHCSLGKSHKTGLTVYKKKSIICFQPVNSNLHFEDCKMNPFGCNLDKILLH